MVRLFEYPWVLVTMLLFVMFVLLLNLAVVS